MKKQYVLKVKYEQMLWAIGGLHKAVLQVYRAAGGLHKSTFIFILRNSAMKTGRTTLL